MSDYRPWEAQSPQAPVSEPLIAMPDPATSSASPPGVAEPAALERTAPGPAKPEPAPAAPAKTFEAPPGLAAAVPTDRPRQTAAGMLLWTGGFLLVAAIIWMATLSLAIELERIDMRYGGYGDFDDIGAMQQLQDVGAWVIAGSLLFLVPGVALLYDQAWARPLAYVAASVALLVVPPFGTILGIVGLVGLSRMEGP